MKPAFQLSVEKVDATLTAAARLLDLTISMGGGMHSGHRRANSSSDSCQITFDDSEPRIVLPRKSAVLTVALGYGFDLVDMGSYVVDEVELEGPPDKLMVRARGTNLSASATATGQTAGLKVQRARSWHATTLGAVLADVAGDAGLVVAAEPGILALAVAHLDQVDESDVAFLGRLGHLYDLHVLAQGPRLVAVAQDSALSATGKGLGVVALQPSDVHRYRVTKPDRYQYDAVVARWYSLDAAAAVPSMQGTPGGKTFTIRRQYPDEASARNAAKSSLARFQRATGELELDLTGNPRLGVGTRLYLAPGLFRSGLAGTWIIKSGEHHFTGGGLTTSVKAHPGSGTP